MKLHGLTLRKDSSTLLKCENKAAISIASNPVLHEKTKHLEIYQHFVRDKVKTGEIVPAYVSSNDQLADVLTKILPVA